MEVRAIALDRPISVRVGGERYAVEPSAFLRLDESGATALAARERGHDSFRTRVRALADPSPPRLLVDPVLFQARPLDGNLDRLERKLPDPKRAQVSMDGVALTPGDRIDGPAFVAALEAAVLRGDRELEAPLTHVEPKLTTRAAEAAFAEARELVSAPVTLAFKDEDVGQLSPARLAKLVRFRPDGTVFRVSFDPKRIAKVEPTLDPWRARAVNARFVVEGAGVRIQPPGPGSPWTPAGSPTRSPSPRPPRSAAPT